MGISRNPVLHMKQCRGCNFACTGIIDLFCCNKCAANDNTHGLKCAREFVGEQKEMKNEDDDGELGELSKSEDEDRRYTSTIIKANAKENQRSYWGKVQAGDLMGERRATDYYLAKSAYKQRQQEHAHKGGFWRWHYNDDLW